MISDVLAQAIERMREYDDSPLYQGELRDMIDDLIADMKNVLAYLDAPPPMNDDSFLGKNTDGTFRYPEHEPVNETATGKPEASE